MKPYLQNGLLVLVTVIVCLGVAETVVRLVVPPPPLRNAEQGLAGIVMFDDRLESRYRPNSRTVIRSQYGEFEVNYEINELGLRDRPLPTLETAKSRRILFHGNSLAEGWGVSAEKSFVRLAEEQVIRNAPGHPVVTVVNAGISGYGAAQSYLLFKELRESVRPDAVVFVYVSTMVHFDHGYLARADVDSSGLATGLSVEAMLKGDSTRPAHAADALISPTVRWLAEHSALVRLAVLSMIARAERQRIIPGDPATDLLAGVRGDPALLSKLHEPSLRHVAAIADLARSAGIPFTLVHLPLPHQLSAHEWTKGRSAYGLDERIYPASDREVVAAFCQREKITCIAAHDALKAAVAQTSSAKKLFHTYDFHPNEEGNAALGSWMSQVPSLWRTAPFASRDRTRPYN